jgi:hypothetical protein
VGLCAWIGLLSSSAVAITPCAYSCDKAATTVGYCTWCMVTKEHTMLVLW